MFEHLKKHRNVYSLLFLTLVALMVAWLFLSVEKLDIQMSKITGSIFSARPAQTQIIKVDGTITSPTNPDLNRGEDITVSGSTSRADLNDPNESIGVTVPGNDTPSDSDSDASADVSGVQGDAGDLPGSPGNDDEAESN